jgi:hypothetical protein
MTKSLGPSTNSTTDGPQNSPFRIHRKSIIITDIGIGNKSDAFYWLSLGCRVYDFRWREITVESLERKVDSNDIMNPIHLRGALWKTVADNLWLRDEGGTNGPVPTQPGMDVNMAGQLKVYII